jgi:hypothetical protein
MFGDDWRLEDVPWVMYYDGDFAVHGAYWHANFGTPTSHGCVNVLAEDARWVYRWSMPAVDYEQHLLVVTEGGTPVIVSV